MTTNSFSFVWFTGLSGAGKSTLAHETEARLHELGHKTMVLDGDNVRHGLCSDLGFTMEDRDENLRRVGEMAKFFLEAGVIILSAFISPLARERVRIRALMPEGDFIEVYCAASVEVCERRDPKGLYAKARAGTLLNFTGVSSPYEAPLEPELRMETGRMGIDDCVNIIVERVLSRRG